MTIRGRNTLLLGIALVLSTGTIAAGYEVMAVTNGGEIGGRVVFNGPKPPPRKIVPSKDKEVCGGQRETAQMVVSPEGAVAEAIVFIRKIEQGKAWEKPAGPPLLSNSQCEYTPHVQVVQIGTDMEFSNADPVFHNLHAFVDKSTVHNVSLPKGGRKIRRTLGEPGLVRVECDAHPWMLAWIYVAESPYYALTGPDGRFVIKDIPPGTYTLVAWQEYAGFHEIPVTVKAGGSTPLTVTLTKRGADK